MLGQSPWLFLSMLAVAFLGFGLSTFRTGNSTLIQEVVPDNLRGQVQSIYHFDHGYTPLASFIIGVFAEIYTPTGAVTAVGLLSLALAVYFLCFFRRVRQLG